MLVTSRLGLQGRLQTRLLRRQTLPALTTSTSPSDVRMEVL